MIYGAPLAIAAWWGASLASALAGLASGRPRGRVATALRVGGLVAPWVYYGFLRPRWLAWGATRDEVAGALPGDDVVPNPTAGSTRAITIDAEADEVWRWLVQIGYGRGGWYSHDRLEAAAGAGDFVEGRSATRIHPELQQLAPGDLLRVSPWTAFRVVLVDPPRALVLASGPEPTALMPPSSWAFALTPLGPHRTRLVVRGRSAPDLRAPLEAVAAHLLEVPHFVMERAMMRGLKDRAGRASRARRHAGV
jgi:hypothetical protein